MYSSWVLTLNWSYYCSPVTTEYLLILLYSAPSFIGVLIRYLTDAGIKTHVFVMSSHWDNWISLTDKTINTHHRILTWSHWYHRNLMERSYEWTMKQWNCALMSWMHQASVQCVVLSRGGSNSNLQNVQVQVQRSVVQTSIDVVITAAAVAVINVRARVQVSGPTTTMVTTALLPGARVLESGVITHDLLLLSFSWLLTHCHQHYSSYKQSISVFLSCATCGDEGSALSCTGWLRLCCCWVLVHIIDTWGCYVCSRALN